MLKHVELSLPESCLNKAKDDEMIFVLLARDPAAPYAIREWTQRRIMLGKNTADDPQIVEALACAEQMERQQRRMPRADHGGSMAGHDDDVDDTEPTTPIRLEAPQSK